MLILWVRGWEPLSGRGRGTGDREVKRTEIRDTHRDRENDG